MDILKTEADRSSRFKKPLSVALFDIDDFKHYNDDYSHSAGDEILKEAAKLMLNCCREHDVVGRIGGDEFAVIFWDGPKIDQNQPQQERRGEAKGAGRRSS